MSSNSNQPTSLARKQRRDSIVATAVALVGSQVGAEFDPAHSLLCAIDVVMIVGAPWLREGMERDFLKDESGYKKIGGSSNTPQMNYFFRRPANLIHYLKRQGFYIPRGENLAKTGMACFFDWGDRGRFNFTPDRSGIIVRTEKGCIKEVILALNKNNSPKNQTGFIVKRIRIKTGGAEDQALFAYSDLP